MNVVLAKMYTVVKSTIQRKLLLYKSQRKSGVETLEIAIWTGPHTEPAPRYSNETVDGGCKDCIAKFQLRQSIFVHRSPGTLLSSTSSWL